jgi:hypothetical protein
MSEYATSERSDSSEDPVPSCFRRMLQPWKRVAKSIPVLGTVVEVGEAVQECIPVIEEVVETRREKKSSSSATVAGKGGEKPLEIVKISDFWKPKAGTLPVDTLVSITGQLSRYAPMVLGHPMQKREAHRAYRLSLSDGEQKGTLGPTEVDALLSCSAGQMVLRMEPDSPNMYLGLYHSIVRNSVPVFVNKDYYGKNVKRMFAKNRNVIEATIRGRVCSMPNDNFLKAFVEERRLMGRIGPRMLEDMGKPIHGIMVDGGDTSIKAVGTSRYLDGDIWVALEHEGQHAVISRFVDLADANDVRQEAAGLEADKDRLFENWKVVLQFDQVDRLISGYETSSTAEWIQELTSGSARGRS